VAHYLADLASNFRFFRHSSDLLSISDLGTAITLDAKAAILANSAFGAGCRESLMETPYARQCGDNSLKFR
jgi:hypothetical protein